MVRCPKCNEENPPKFRLCGYCGAQLTTAEAQPVHEVRKTVTLIFSDLKDSTALGEQLDSEALHEVKERYFNAMAAEIKRHGGKIEKYIGDAIMAVFGLPRAHEDDALRAVRAAIGMKTVLHELNDVLSARFGVVLANRTGVNTGEVVAIDDPSADQKLATGDAVNVTARLEQAAPANEIYIGEITYQLVRDAVEVEKVEPLLLKGKSQPVAAYRLLSAQGHDGNVRRIDTPVVGRDEELALLHSAWATVRAKRHARLVTVIGDAGIGKSRLVRELMDQVGDDAQIVCGRCLAYGEGITFWPLREMVHSAAGIVSGDTPDIAREKLLRACTGDADIADRIASAIGLSAAPFPLHEIYWGARRFLQMLAAQRPMLALFDDIHWAEPALLDLLDNLLETIGDAPVLLLATARNELLEERPQWGEREHSSRIVLQPLGRAAASQVVTNLLGAVGLPRALLGRIVSTAEGNPLYVEQMLSMLIETGAVQREGDQWVSVRAHSEIAIPPTIQALLEARLDKLQRGERAAAEPAAVIGMEFPQPAVESLAPPPLREGVKAQLSALSRKHFIRPMTSTDSETRYRFEHHLVRDTVYNGLLKRARATMHVEFVKWADQVNAESDRGQEFEAILGYHLEQAYKYLGELGPIDQTGAAFGRDGARRLGSAARRALARGDNHAASSLFQRAAALLPVEDAERLDLLPDLAEALGGLGRFGDARAILKEARELAERAGNERIAASARVISTFVRLYSRETDGDTEDPLDMVERLRPALERDGAYSELANAWRVVLTVHAVAGRISQASEAAQQALKCAQLAKNDRLAARVALSLASIALFGPMPVQDAISLCEKTIQQGLSDRVVEASLLCTLSSLHAMHGELHVARGLLQQGRKMLDDLGGGARVAYTGIHMGIVELHGGDLKIAEEQMQRDVEALDNLGERYHLPAIAVLLARIIREQGRDADAKPLLEMAQRLSAPNDVSAQAAWRAVLAPIVARQGEVDEAFQLASTAVEMFKKAESPGFQADALCELATVLSLAGKTDEAHEALMQAAELYRSKGNVVALSRLQAQRDSNKGKGSADRQPPVCGASN